MSQKYCQRQAGGQESRRSRYPIQKPHAADRPASPLSSFWPRGAFWYFGAAAPAARPARQPSPPPPGISVSMPVVHLRRRQGRTISSTRAASITIRYFVIKSADGVIRAAFDACDVCWPAGKGYAQDGEFMVCRNCGQRFHSTKVNEVKGGCNPAPLERRVENGMLLIRVSDILEGKGYFDFSGKA
ncbi:MAG: DUF2318 domain-containing protein [Desulfobacterales bacterium]|nr:DUF2318 domain-containing protein [Desulfobacterales bacterium]